MQKTLKKYITIFQTLFIFNCNTQATDNLQDRLNKSFEIHDEKSKDDSDNLFVKFIKKKPVKIALWTVGSIVFTRILAHELIYLGHWRSSDLSKLEHLKAYFIVKEVNIKCGSLNLHGYTFTPSDGQYDSVCMCFSGKGGPNWRVVNSSMSNNRTLYICVDYPSFGKSDYSWLTEETFKTYADSLYNYVEKTYKNKKIVAFGYCLGGYPASLTCLKKKVKEIYLIAPVCLNGVVPEFLCYLLWGYKLDSIDNILNCNHKCKIFICSGNSEDFMNLYQTIYPKFSNELEKYKNANLDKRLKIVENALHVKNPNIDVKLKIFNNGHLDVFQSGHNYINTYYLNHA